MITVTKTVVSDAAEKPFKHESTTFYGNVSDTDKRVLTALEIGEAANIKAMADLSVGAISTELDAQ